MTNMFYFKFSLCLHFYSLLQKSHKEEIYYLSLLLAV